MAKEADATSKAIAAIRKKFKGASVRKLAEGSDFDLTEVIPTGIDVLDNWVFGCGGLPVGRCMEVYADEAAGKTSFGFEFLAAAQRAGGMAVLYETERALIPERADIFGVDREQVILGEPKTMEDVLAQLRALLKLIPDGVGPNVIVWDSLAASPTEAEIKGKPQPGDQARQMSQNLRVMAAMLAPKRTCLVIINQVRMKIGVLFGNPETTPGGNALKYFASIRLAMWKGAGIKEGPDVVGHRITVKAVKNKLAFPMRKVSIRLDYRYGFDTEWSTIDFAKNRELIPEGAKLTPATHERALEELVKMPGWYPNKFDPAAATPEEPNGGQETPTDRGTADSKRNRAAEGSEGGTTAAKTTGGAKQKTGGKKKAASKGSKTGKKKE